MSDQESQKQTKPNRNREGRTDALLEKARAEIRAAKSQAKAQEKAKLKAEEELRSAQDALAALQAELDQERRARLAAEQTLAEAEQDEPPITSLEVSPASHRLSFVVRVATDTNGKPLRTEIEHVQSGKKEVHPAFDHQRIGAFIESCAVPVAAPSLEEAQQPARKLEPEKAAANLVISEVRPARSTSGEERDLILDANSYFKVWVKFALTGADALALTAKKPAFAIRVLAQEVTQGNTIELIDRRAALEVDRLDYNLNMESEPLAPGLYRLLTFVTLPTLTSKGGYYEGPIFQVGKDI